MRVSFSIPLKPLSGKHKFAILLAEALSRKGIKVTNKKPDINIVFLKGKNNKCKNIFRLDGVWMNSSIEYGSKNRKLRNHIKSCDGVVYQSEFCKAAADKFLGSFNNYSVIMNGSRCPPDIIGLKRDRPYVLAFCRWRPHKRLKDTVVGFLNSGLKSKFDLLIAGDGADYVVKDKSVKYIGKVSGNNLWSLISGCEFVSHLAYIDWCPNSVVEALVCHKNVLHTSTGGTAEVVKNNGICVHDKAWDFSPVRLYDPPELSIDELSTGFSTMVSLPPPRVEYLDIDVSAEQYITYFESILK